MTRNRCLWAVLPIAWMVGCQGNVSSEGTATTPAATTATVAAAPVAAPVAAATTPSKALGHHRGLSGPFVRAARDLALTAAQQGSLDSLEATLGADGDVVDTAMKALHADLVAGVRAGALDTAKLAADGTAVEHAMAAHHTRDVAALASLHDLLDPSQRTAVVAAVRARHAAREAHMATWKEQNGAHGDWQTKRLDKLTTELGLDVDQQAKVVALRAQHEPHLQSAGTEPRRDEMKQHGEALLAAFAGDTFGAEQAGQAALPGVAGHEGKANHRIAWVSQLLPILRADQREKLASSMESSGRGPAEPAEEPVE